jgi:choline transport protein
MNYSILIMGIFGIAMVIAWYTEGRKLFSPPEYLEGASAIIEGVESLGMTDFESGKESHVNVSRKDDGKELA